MDIKKQGEVAKKALLKNNILEYKRLFFQIIKFSIIGGGTFVIDFLILMILVEYYNIRPVVAATISFLVGVSINYIFSYFWVYNTLDGKSRSKTYVVFVSLALLMVVYNSTVIYVGSEVFNVHYMLCKVFASASAALFNFITRKILFEKFFVIFRQVKI